MPYLLHAPCTEAAKFRCDLERILHDDVTTGMSTLAVRLGALAVSADDAKLGGGIDAAQEAVCRVVDDLRWVGTVIYPPVLDSVGLGPALRAVAESRDLRLQLDLPRRHLSEEARSRAGLLITDYLHSVSPGAAVRVRMRGRRFLRVSMTEKKPGRVHQRTHRAVLRCG